MKYSQNNEDDIINDFFKDKKGGFFIEIGSYDPFIFSNVRKLYENGWGGVMVEPSADCFNRLLKEYGDKDNVILINRAVVVNDIDEITFYDSHGDAVSTTNIEHATKWSNIVKFDEIKVKTMRLLNLIDEYGNLCDFINIDVESTNYELFLNLPNWFLEKVSLICIEHDGHDNDIINKCEKYGFVKLLQNQENIIMGKNGNIR